MAGAGTVAQRGAPAAAGDGAAAKKRVANLVVLGCGNVGRALLQRILDTRGLHARAGLHLAVVAVTDSKGAVLSRTELDDSAIRSVMLAKAEKVSLSKWVSSVEGTKYQYSADAGMEDTLQMLRFWSSPCVLVDCTANEEIGKLLGLAVVQGFCVVLSNKLPITSNLDLYDQITSVARRFRCESTVGAGLPVMASFSRLLASGDPIHRIVGAFSGTLGYVMSELEDGQPLSKIVIAAKSLGYTEPDPRDDLNGNDVARKALIMARAMGRRINLEDIEIESLYPPEMDPQHMSLDDFLAKGLPTLDARMRERMDAAQGIKCVLRYVAMIDRDRYKVGLKEISADSCLGMLRGSDNLIEIHTDCYYKTPLVIQGTGAGNEATAAGVLADILDLRDLYSPAS